MQGQCVAVSGSRRKSSDRLPSRPICSAIKSADILPIELLNNNHCTLVHGNADITQQRICTGEDAAIMHSYHFCCQSNNPLKRHTTYANGQPNPGS